MELYIVELNSYRGNSNDTSLLVNGNEDGKMFVIVSVDLGQVVNVDYGYDSAEEAKAVAVSVAAHYVLTGAFTFDRSPNLSVGKEQTFGNAWDRFATDLIYGWALLWVGSSPEESGERSHTGSPVCFPVYGRSSPRARQDKLNQESMGTPCGKLSSYCIRNEQMENGRFRGFAQHLGHIRLRQPLRPGP